MVLFRMDSDWHLLSSWGYRWDRVVELWGCQVPLCLRLPHPHGGRHHLQAGRAFPASGDHPAFPHLELGDVFSAAHSSRVGHTQVQGL